MERVNVTELLEDPSLPQDVVASAYRDLARTQRFLGNARAILRKLRHHATPIKKVLDIGCGQGALLAEIHQKLGVEVIGFDLRPAPATSVPILTGNAVVDPLPTADVAISVCLAHHLTESEVIQLIQNAARSCPRLILLDLVRHWIPLTLFRVFLTPFLHPLNAADGQTSVKRAFTPQEFRRIAETAIKGTPARLTHTVAPFYTRQILDIEFQKPIFP